MISKRSFASLLGLVIAGFGALLLVHCEDSSSGGGGLGDFEAGPGFDAQSSTDAAPFDAAAEDAANGGDGATDGGADADAGPHFDDAGCPLPTGVTADAQDAGIPSNGLVLWLRADVGLNTINAVADGGVVCRWDDVSGHGNSFTPAGATSPTRSPAGFGAQPAVSFNGPAQNLTRADVLGIGATSGRTVALYEKTADTTRRWEPFFQGLVGSPGTYFGIDANTFNTAGGLEGVFVTNNSYDTDIATTTNARSHILSISSFAVGTSLPGALTYSVDGTVRTLSVAQANGANLVQDFSTANFSSVGYGDPGFTGGLIGEVIVYDRELTAGERTMIDQHFAAKY